MDIEDRILEGIKEYIAEKGKQPNKVYISRDLCGELGIDITIDDRELLCDEWIFNLKVVPTWFNNTIFVTHDEKLETKEMLIERFMSVPSVEVDEKLSNQIDEDLKYLHNYIAFEEYYDEWCKRNNK